MMAPATAQSATRAGFTVPFEASTPAAIRAISPGNGIPRLSMPMISPTSA